MGEKRRQNKLKVKHQTDEEEMAERIAVEERKLLIAQRKLESIRLLDELLERVKVVKGQGKKVRNLEAELLETAKRVSNKAADAAGTMTYKDRDEKLLRDKLVTRLKEKEVQKMEHFGERLKNAKENNYIETSDDGVEDISDEDLDQSYGDEFKGKEDDDLRLTSTDDDNEPTRNDSNEDIYDQDSDVEKHTNAKTNTGSGPMPEKDDTSDEEQQNNISQSTKLYDDLPEPKQSEPREEDLSYESTTKGKKKKKKDKKKRELATQITSAKRIADKEKREI